MAEDLQTPERGKKKVNFFAGRFQPITRGHLKVARQMMDKNGLPTVLIVVRGQKSDRSPIPLDLTLEMTRKLVQRDYIQDVVVSPSAFFYELVLNLRQEGYEPYLWGAGPDRIGEYQKQIDKLASEIIPPAQTVEMFEVQRFGNISATKVRNAVKENDPESFEEMVPKELSGYFDDLQKVLGK